VLWWRHPEPLVCGVRGHILDPAPSRRVTAGERTLVPCLRCDAYVDVDALNVEVGGQAPRHGDELRAAIILRVISIERAVHAVLFGIAAVGLFLLESNLGGLQASARFLVRNAASGIAGPAQLASRDVLTRQMARLISLNGHTLALLAVTSTVYAVLEGTEAVGLWYEKRWAEYLTALATAGFLPFEINELAKRVTTVRAGALVINLAVLAWLVWKKELFGIARLRRRELPSA
jgi:uncharacterized membrane protein (DUF2068 family)